MQLELEDVQDNPHLLAERDMLPRARIYVHVLFPTQFGLHQDSIHKGLACSQCVVCRAELTSMRKRKLFQVWIRIAGGEDVETDAWCYTMRLTCVCKDCSTVCGKYPLLVLSGEQIEQLQLFVRDVAFKEKSVHLDNFLLGTRTQDDIYCALVDNYLWRFTYVNSDAADMCWFLFGRTCFFCKVLESEPCPKCKCIRTCRACQYKLKRQHQPTVCDALRRGRIFHTDPLYDYIFHVERSREGRLLRYNPVQVLSEEEESLEKEDGSDGS